MSATIKTLKIHEVGEVGRKIIKDKLSHLPIDPETECINSHTANNYLVLYSDGPRRVVINKIEAMLYLNGMEYNGERIGMTPLCGNKYCVNPDHYRKGNQLLADNRKLAIAMRKYGWPYSDIVKTVGAYAYKHSILYAELGEAIGTQEVSEFIQKLWLIDYRRMFSLYKDGKDLDLNNDYLQGFERDNLLLAGAIMNSIKALVVGSSTDADEINERIEMADEILHLYGQQYPIRRIEKQTGYDFNFIVKVLSIME